MKKLIVLSLVCLSSVWSTWLENIPQKINLSNGEVFDCFASGDQYSHRVHDYNNYTIVLNNIDGEFYYGLELRGDVIPSQYKVGSVDPRLTELIPGAMISRDNYNRKKQFYEQRPANRPKI